VSVVDATYFGRVFKRLGEDVLLLGRVRPVGREALVGAASEQETARRGEVLDHPLHGDVVEVAQVPAAVLEAAGGVLVGGAGRLHDPVKGHPLLHDHPAHLGLLAVARSFRGFRGRRRGPHRSAFARGRAIQQ
jgi:hypothetical protein